MRILSCLALAIVAALALSQGALGAPPALLAPSAGVSVGSGTALVEVQVAASYSDRGSRWGWRAIASTNPAVVADPWPFAQLDYSALRRELNDIRNDYAARGMLYSGFYEAAVRDAKDAFFSSGMSADFSRAPLAFGSGVAKAVALSSDTSTLLYLDRPGTWYIAVATATEAQVEWSGPVAVTVEAAPQPPPPVRPVTPPVSATRIRAA